ncbi:signal transduction histidine kinase, LytS [Paenibacillus algicola]|uniref:histidine kinase n=1 Tax=Paenibacillus algicola TaxID=2565926 RepID=A0A4P8XG58_9BACL|nr:signal transduction histidine kinase, LytS [Paenibacillus algicola]
MNNVKWTGFTAALLVLLTIVNIISFIDTDPPPAAEQGTLDLRSWEGLGQEIIPLKGEWEFYPGELLDNPAHAVLEPEIQKVPGNWKQPGGSALTSGTFRLSILLEPERAGPQSLLVPLIRSAHRVYVNGTLAGDDGEVALSEKGHVGQVRPYATDVKDREGVMELLIQVSNYDHAVSGGIIQAIEMGPSAGVDRKLQQQAAFEFGILVAFALFALLFGVIHAHARGGGYFYLACFFVCNMLVTMMQGYRWIYVLWPSVESGHVIPIHWAGSIGIVIFLFLYVSSRYEYLAVHMWRTRILGVSLAFVVGVLILPTSVTTTLLWLWLLISTLIHGLVLALLVAAMKQGEQQARFEFLAFCMFAALSLLNMLRILGYDISEPLYFGQVLGFSMMMTMLLVLQFFRVYRQARHSIREWREADMRKDQLLLGISQQLHTPIQTILSVANARLHGPEPLMPELQSDLRLITAIGWSATELMNEAVDVSRLRGGDLALQLRPVRLSRVLEEVMEQRLHELSQPLHGHGEVVCQEVPRSLYVQADEKRLVQLLGILLRLLNRKMDGGAMTLQAQEAGDQAVLRISLSGSGAAAAHAQFRKAWEEEQPWDEASQSQQLGLLLLKQLTGLHEASLDFRENGLDMDLTLLRAPEDAEPLPQAPQPPVWKQVEHIEASEAGRPSPEILRDPMMQSLPASESIQKDGWLSWSREPQRGGSILLVDEDEMNVVIVKRLLELDGHHVMTARDGLAVLKQPELISRSDLLILNKALPGLSGLELCRKLRRQYSLAELPVLLLTSKSYPNHAIAAREAGANDFLAKPIEPSELRVRVQTLLELKRAVGEQIQMELAFLQAQIKPHFLFNTLNSIAALSKSRPGEMMELMMELGNYLRGSFRFDPAEQLSPFARELSLVKSYLHIEQVRFRERLRYELDIECDSFRLPPLTIQPLVENAVRHGIMKQSSGGLVQVKVYKEAGEIVIKVIDNGVGMDAGKALQGRGASVSPGSSSTSSTSSSGVGIRNIDSRLRRIYGKGLSIISVPGEGTEVSVHLPLERSGRCESDSRG